MLPNKDYVSDKEVFGPVFIDFLNLVIYNYPDNPNIHDMSNMLNLLNNIQKQFPCEECAWEFHAFIAGLWNHELSSRNSLQEFFLQYLNRNKLVNKITMEKYLEILDKKYK